MNGRPVFGIDVDGTLAEYHEFFKWFVGLYIGRRMPTEPYTGGPFHKHLGIGKARYRECKLAFRQSGLKRAMPAAAGASQLTTWLRGHGAEVVICSTRPYLHLSNIEPDLKAWLLRNRIRYDDIILGEHKYRELKRGYGNRVVAVLDDLPEMVLQANSVGLTAILREQPYNTPTNYLSVATLEQAGDLMVKLMEER